jgi:hypothetical protein
LKLSTAANVLPQKSAGTWYRIEGETAKAEPEPQTVQGRRPSTFAAVRACGFPQEQFRLGFGNQPLLSELSGHGLQAVEVCAVIAPRSLARAKLLDAAPILIHDGAWRSIRAIVANIRDAVSVAIELNLAAHFISRQDSSIRGRGGRIYIPLASQQFADLLAAKKEPTFVIFSHTEYQAPGGAAWHKGGRIIDPGKNKRAFRVGHELSSSSLNIDHGWENAAIASEEAVWKMYKTMKNVCVNHSNSKRIDSGEKGKCAGGGERACVRWFCVSTIESGFELDRLLGAGDSDTHEYSGQQ